MKENFAIDAINHIDNDLVEEYAKEKEHLKRKRESKKRTPWIKWASVAACFALVICIGALTIPNLIQEQDGGGNNESYAYWFNSFLYESISVGDDAYYPEVRALAKGATSDLKYDIKKEHLGEYIGEFPLVNNEIGKAYHFAAYPEYDSVIIVEKDGKYTFYIATGNHIEPNLPNSSIILTTYGLPENCKKINIDRERDITDSAVFEHFFAIVNNKEAVERTDIDRIVWEAWCEENGDDSVFFDGKSLTFKDEITHEQYRIFSSKNSYNLWYDTTRGFYDQLVVVSVEYNYFRFCGNSYLISDAEAEQIIDLLGLETN